MIRDERAVSSTVTHALAIAITSMLLTGVVVGAGQLMDDRRQYVAEKGLENVGAAVTSDLVRLDQFDPEGADGNVSFPSHHPDRVGDQRYAIHLSPDPDRTTIYLNSTGRADVTVPVRFENETAVCESRVSGGRIVVAYNESRSCIELREGPT